MIVAKAVESSGNKTTTALPPSPPPQATKQQHTYICISVVRPHTKSDGGFSVGWDIVVKLNLDRWDAGHFTRWNWKVHPIETTFCKWCGLIGNLQKQHEQPTTTNNQQQQTTTNNNKQQQTTQWLEMVRNTPTTPTVPIQC
jgi:hypothetical protein